MGGGDPQVPAGLRQWHPVQALQQKLQQKSNRRDEVLEAMVSFAGKQSKTGSNMAGNLA